MSRFAHFFSFFTIIIKLTCLVGMGQSKITGRVMDNATKQPIPFASIQIVKTNFGTITDQYGRFSLSVSTNEAKRIITSSIGYRTDTAHVHSSNFNIYLQPISNSLDEIVVMPDSSLKVLLRKAFDNIGVNYHSSATMLEGIYRENLRAEKNYLYFGEAYLRVYKRGYQNSEKQSGQIEVLSSRIEQSSNSDSLNNVKFYGGAFLAHSVDYVIKKSDFINPQYFKKYDYQILKITNYESKKIYTIEFKQKSKPQNHGLIHIQDATKAYIGFEVYIKPPEQPLSLAPYKNKKLFYKVIYAQNDNKWYLKYALRHIEGFNFKSKIPLIGDDEFLTSDIQIDTVAPIPFNKQLMYEDVFVYQAQKKQETNQPFLNQFQGNNFTPVFSLDSITQIFHSIKPISTKPTRSLPYYLSKFESRFSLQYLPYFISGSTAQLNYSQLVFNQKLDQQFPVFLSTSLAYEFDKHHYLRFTNASNIVGKIWLSHQELNIGYKNGLTTRRSLILFNMTAGLYYSKYGVLMGNIDSKGILFNSKEIAFNKGRFYAGNSVLGMNLTAGLDLKLRRNKYLFLQAGYYQPLTIESKLFLKPTSIFRSVRSVNLSDISHSFMIDNSKTQTIDLQSKVSASLGIMFSF